MVRLVVDALRLAEQLGLFPPAPGLALRPSQADPTVRRWQRDHEPEPEPEPVGLHETCPFCGTEELDLPGLHGVEVHTAPGRGDRWLTWTPCCYDRADEVAAHGFRAVYGVDLSTVASVLLGRAVLVDEDDPDAVVSGELAIYDPTTPGRSGPGSATAPKGWQAEVFELVDEHHRHHPAPQGAKFSIAVDNAGLRVGVAVVGRPVSRRIQEAEPGTLEVTRVATWGHHDLRRNASSKLYAAAGKRARALGYDKLITYTLAEESGVSLRASGFVPVGRTKAEAWGRPSRSREVTAPTGAKVRWARGLTKQARAAVEAARINLDEG